MNILAEFVETVIEVIRDIANSPDASGREVRRKAFLRGREMARARKARAEQAISLLGDNSATEAWVW